MAEQLDFWPAELYDELHRMRRLPIACEMQCGESLSSWIVRVADQHGMSVQQLGSWLMGRGRQVFGEDVDRGAWRGLIDRIAQATGHSPDILNLGTLRVYEGLLWGEIAEQGTTRWVLPIVKRGTQRAGFGVQYCAGCLAGDASPHLRLAWRLAFCVACPEHQCLLRDRCGGCQAPVAVHRWRTGKLRSIGSSGIVHCHACGSDRRKPVGELHASLELLTAQRRMSSTLAGGAAVIKRDAVHALSFFAGAAMIWALLDDPRAAKAVWHALGLNVPTFVEETKDRYGSFERRSVLERAELLRGFGRLLEVGVDEFMRYLAARGISSRKVLGYANSQGVPPPFWYWSCAREHLDRTMYTPSDAELDAAIHYQVRAGSNGSAKVRDVCRILGMATRSNVRVARRIREIGVL